MRKLLGKKINQIELEPKILETIDCGEYIRQKVSYNIEENERINAYIAIPKNIKENCPAVFCFHQHGSNYSLGKSEVFGIDGDKNQFYAHELAKKGFITFAPDALSFEERAVKKNDFYQSIYLQEKQIIKGVSPLGKTIWDIKKGIDYLINRSEVDNENIGFIGHSYGGRMAIWAPAFDKRIKVSVSNCGCISQKEALERDIGLQIDVCGFEQLPKYDIDWAIKKITPRKLYISATDNDKFSFGAENIKPQNGLRVKIWNGEHIFNNKMRYEAYKFLEENLK